MAKFRVEMWRTVEVIETGYFEVEAETADAAKEAALDKLKVCEMPSDMKLGDTVGTTPWIREVPMMLDEHGNRSVFDDVDQ